MGEIADMHANLYDPDDHNGGFINHDQEIRKDGWLQNNGESIDIGDMTDKHLLNAYKLSGDERLFAEMVVRLFEVRVSWLEKNSGFLIRS